MKKFIFFRSDRLGDFIILTRIIKSIKEKYKNSHITVLGSNLNHNLIKKYQIIDKVYIYNKNASFYEKINLLTRILKNHYYASFAVDGKSFSNFCNILIKAKYKLGLVYRYKFLNIFWFSKPNFLYNYLIFKKYETFTSKKDLQKIEHLPSKLLNLANFFKLSLIPSIRYYFKPNLDDEKRYKKFYAKNIRKKYILVHLDEKWTDINSINNELFQNFCNLQKRIKTKIVITSFNNKCDYFINLKKNISKRKNKNLILVENANLNFFERLINHSYCSISCHSGFLVQISGSNSTKLIDIINKKDLMWYSCWKPKNTSHKFIFKSDNKRNISINKIFKNLAEKIINIKNF